MAFQKIASRAEGTRMAAERPALGRLRGAIVLDSDPEEEFEEMPLKACSVLRAVRQRDLG